MKLIQLNGVSGYKKLNHLPFNRDYILRKGLVASMKKRGFIIPILVCYTTAIDGVRQLYILDGQHRALAAQYLDITFYANVLGIEPETKKN